MKWSRLVHALTDLGFCSHPLRLGKLGNAQVPQLHADEFMSMTIPWLTAASTMSTVIGTPC